MYTSWLMFEISISVWPDGNFSVRKSYKGLQVQPLVASFIMPLHSEVDKASGTPPGGRVPSAPTTGFEGRLQFY